MTEFMQPLWLWMALGLLLLCLEMATGTLYLLWLGIAALLMALVAWAFPTLSVAMQAFNFAWLSAFSLLAWRKREKRTPSARVGQSQGEEIGRQGLVTVAIAPQQPGKVRFEPAVMGSKEWTAYADTVLEAGQTVILVAVEGNSLRVAAQAA